MYKMRERGSERKAKNQTAADDKKTDNLITCIFCLLAGAERKRTHHDPGSVSDRQGRGTLLTVRSHGVPGRPEHQQPVLALLHMVPVNTATDESGEQRIKS